MRSNIRIVARVDLARIRDNARSIARRTGVPIIAVVKANAYGLGAARVAEAIGDLVDAFYVFDLAEAAEYRLFERTGKRTIALLGDSQDPRDYVSLHVQPAVWTLEQATALKPARPVLSVDTGQQRFAIAPPLAEPVLRAGGCEEAMTHATRLAHVEQLRDAFGGRRLRLHAAGSALLDEPAARLDAVRPGFALYEGAARVTARLIEVRDSTGPAGYSGFGVPRHGIIGGGYVQGVRQGPCLVNGRQGRVLEVGMQSSFIECEPGDRAGDEVVLLGEGLTETEIAKAWGVTPQTVLVQLVRQNAQDSR